MTEPQIQFFLNPEAKEKGLRFAPPREADAGFDLPALQDVIIEPGKSLLISTGVHLAIPKGWVGIVRDRSSVALKGGVVSAGVIDAAYRGEVKVLMHNLSSEAFSFRPGDRIAQCVVVPHLQGLNCAECTELKDLGDTSRGAGGFGSTGL